MVANHTHIQPFQDAFFYGSTWGDMLYTYVQIGTDCAPYKSFFMPHLTSYGRLLHSLLPHTSRCPAQGHHE